MSGEHHFHGGKFTPRPILYFDALEETSAEAVGVGLVVADGILYWCDGSDFTNVTDLTDYLVADDIASKATIVDAPTAADDPGTAGQIAYDATHIYVCVDTDTWVRADLATWGE